MMWISLKMWNFSSLFILVISSVVATDEAHISTPGDIILGGLFPVHKEGNKENICGEFNEIPGYQYMEAMLFALEKINERSDILPGITLGTVIYDTCRSPTIVADRTKDFIKMTLSQTTQKLSEFAGVIGPFTSGNSKIVGNFLRVFEIPQISYASLSVELSNKDIYNYFFRTVPPDSFFAEALSELAERLGWSYVSLIYSKGIYPETGANEVMKALAKRNICLAKKHRLPRFPRKEDYDTAIYEAASVPEANVIVFVTIQRDSRELLKAKRRNPRAKRLSIVGSIAWSNRDDITKGLGPTADGTITLGHREGENKDFETHFRSLNLSNYKANYSGWFKEFWQKQFQCTLPNSTISPAEKFKTPCKGNESLEFAHMEIAPVRVVINAVNAMAYALHNMQQILCPTKYGLCSKMKPFDRTVLQQFLKNVTFPDSSFGWPIMFDQNNEVQGNYTVLNFRYTKGNAPGSETGGYRYVPIGTWTGKISGSGDITGRFSLNNSDIQWGNENASKPSSICSLPCKAMHVTVSRGGLTGTCCWDCKMCAVNDIITNNTCKTCEHGFRRDANLTECIKLPVTYAKLTAPLSVFLLFLAALGIFADFVAFAAFVLKREHPLVKASGREMCYIMLVGIATIFVVPLISLAKPNDVSCYMARFFTGISFTICYAPLLMKIWRIYRIFKSSNKLRRMSGLIGRRSQLSITLGLITIQGLFFILIASTDAPTSVEKFYEETGELVLECFVTPSVFVAYLSYNVVLMLLCTIYAFLTRQFPKNFNEAMYIGVTMYLTCVVWVVFLACFLNVNDSISRVYWISGASTMIGWITLLGLFAPKLYQVFTKKEIDTNTLVTWRSSVFRQIESTDNETEGSKNTAIVSLKPVDTNQGDATKSQSRPTSKITFASSSKA